MPLQIVDCDVTTLNTDAIVNPADASLPGGCLTGEAKLTPAYGLPWRWVIHTAGPVWQGGSRGEEALLQRCYRNALTLASEQGCERVAVPLSSAGAWGYPPDRALSSAIRAIGAFLMDHEMEVTLVLCDRQDLGPRLFPDLQALVAGQMSMQSAPVKCWDGPAVAPRQRRDTDRPGRPKRDGKLAGLLPRRKRSEPGLPLESARAEREESPCPAPDFAGNLVFYDDACATPFDSSLQDLLRDADESFQQMLLRKIDQRGLTDAECYKRANVDRKLFSKIRKDVHYRPKKATVIAFAIALELDLEETEELLRKAGYALSPSTPFDIIIRYFIQRRNYNIFEINEALFLYDQALLGA